MTVRELFRRGRGARQVGASADFAGQPEASDGDSRAEQDHALAQSLQEGEGVGRAGQELRTF